MHEELKRLSSFLEGRYINFLNEWMNECNTAIKQTSMALAERRQIIDGGAHEFPAARPGQRSALGLHSSLVTSSQP